MHRPSAHSTAGFKLLWFMIGYSLTGSRDSFFALCIKCCTKPEHKTVKQKKQCRPLCGLHPGKS